MKLLYALVLAILINNAPLSVRAVEVDVKNVTLGTAFGIAALATTWANFRVIQQAWGTLDEIADKYHNDRQEYNNINGYLFASWFAKELITAQALAFTTYKSIITSIYYFKKAFNSKHKEVIP